MSSPLTPQGPWSYSRLTTYEQCPLAFKLQYIDRLPQTNNAFAEYGLLCHHLLEKFAVGELMAFDLADAYMETYDQHVIHPFPPFPKGLGLRYYQAGLDFFSGFTGFGKGYEILSVEDKFISEIGGYPFTGVVDLLLKDTVSGKLILTDHKSKAIKNVRRDLADLNKQLYVYAAHVNNQYGVYPDTLRFHLFRDQANIDTPFDIDEYENTIRWVRLIINEIVETQEFQPCLSDYFCRFICSVSQYCEWAQEQQWKKKG